MKHETTLGRMWEEHRLCSSSLRRLHHSTNDILRGHCANLSAGGRRGRLRRADPPCTYPLLHARRACTHCQSHLHCIHCVHCVPCLHYIRGTRGMPGTHGIHHIHNAQCVPWSNHINWICTYIGHFTVCIERKVCMAKSCTLYTFSTACHSDQMCKCYVCKCVPDEA